MGVAARKHAASPAICVCVRVAARKHPPHLFMSRRSNIVMFPPYRGCIFTCGKYLITNDTVASKQDLEVIFPSLAALAEPPTRPGPFLKL